MENFMESLLCCNKTVVAPSCTQAKHRGPSASVCAPSCHLLLAQRHRVWLLVRLSAIVLAFIDVIEEN